MIDRLAGGRRSPKADGDALHALDGLLDHGGELGWGSPARMAKAAARKSQIAHRAETCPVEALRSWLAAAEIVRGRCSARRRGAVTCRRGG